MNIRPQLKLSSTLFLKIVLLLICIFVLSICLFVLPFGILTDKTGYYQPILIGLYIAAIPFFVAIFQARKLLEYIDNSQIFTVASVRAFRNIKYSAFTISLLFLACSPYLFYVGDQDDAPGVILVGYLIIFIAIVIGAFAGLMQKLIQNAVELKSENDLTV